MLYTATEREGTKREEWDESVTPGCVEAWAGTRGEEPWRSVTDQKRGNAPQKNKTTAATFPVSGARLELGASAVNTGARKSHAFRKPGKQKKT